MRILYIFQGYSSHHRAALAYCRIIREWHSFVDRVADADVVVLHCEPHDFASMYRSYGLADKYVVSCAVWEADDLPDAYKRSLELVQEVLGAVSVRYHPRVHVVPYVADDEASPSDDDRAAVRQMIRHDDQCVYYLTVTKIWDKRKNVQALINAFERLAGQMQDARLVIKVGQGDHRARRSDPRIMVVAANLTGPQMRALYECADVYVSPHHAEGWGLTIADALLYKKPVIATGYSGNLEFMNEQNSFLLAYEEDYIRPEDAISPFTAQMRWAYPSQQDLQEKLLLLYRLREDGAVHDAVHRKLQAAEDIHRFSSAQVGRILGSRLDETDEYRKSQKTD
jgi:glycosyltransferase involved in cell wall biosynthesis